MTGPDGLPPARPVEDAPATYGRSSRRWWRRSVFLVPVVFLLAVPAFIRIPYFVVSPGPAENVIPLISVRGQQTYRPKGGLLLTSVYESTGRVTVYQALKGWLDPSEAVVPERDILAPGQTVKQGELVAKSQMDESIYNAALVALTKYTGYPKSHGPGVFVVSVIAGYPADGKLVAEDVILAVNEQRVDSPEALGQAIQANGAGTPLGLTVQRMVEVDGTLQRRTSRVTVTPTIPKNSNRAQIGVEAITNFPVPLYINNEGIGGPSAGLMWTLGLIDWLTPGDLTRGRLIAGTGTILPDGTVGPIGGIQQKVVGAEYAHAVVFFAPVSEAAGARAVAHGITIVPVRTYLDALRYLQGHT
jgi:PDZ domain-containing protein